MNAKKLPLGIKEQTAEQNVSTDTKRPKNPSANTLPTEGFVLEIDGKLKSEHATSEAAMKAGLELKMKYPHIRIVMYGAEQRTRTPVELSEGPERNTVPIS